LIVWSFARMRSGGDFRLIRRRPRLEVPQMIFDGHPEYAPAFGAPGAPVGLFLRQHLLARRLP
jgi:hypothetical protein